jgi:hypothetical protein
MRPHIIEATRHHLIAWWCNVEIVLWIDETLPSAVETAGIVLHRFSANHPQGVGFLQVICEGCQRLPNDSRVAIQHLLRSGRDSIKAAPVVFEGDGFRAATVRAIVSGIAAFSRVGVPHRVYPSVSGAADDLAKVLAPQQASRFAKDLLHAAQEVRRVHGEHMRRFPSVRPTRLRGAPASIPPSSH